MGRCAASLRERAYTTRERRDMSRALESETEPRLGPYCIGIGRALGPRLLCYVMLVGVGTNHSSDDDPPPSPTM